MNRALSVSEGRDRMKDLYIHLLFEMMTNSRRSDRELAKILHVSQPTVTRARNHLESNGLILEYTAIPDFAQIGFELVAFTFFKMRKTVTGEDYESIKKSARAFLDGHSNIILALRGEGMGVDGVMVSLHKNFAEFTEFMIELKTRGVDAEVVGNFLSSLEEPNPYKYLTFKSLKEYHDTRIKKQPKMRD
jgi:DNA-binding Lrp family transcriptional regulator